jgi:DNA-binding transcriptional regulator YbjK
MRRSRAETFSRRFLEAAETVFAVYGFHGADHRAIAEEADVNLAMISTTISVKETAAREDLTTRAGPNGSPGARTA